MHKVRQLDPRFLGPRTSIPEMHLSSPMVGWMGVVEVMLLLLWSYVNLEIQNQEQLCITPYVQYTVPATI